MLWQSRNWRLYEGGRIIYKQVDKKQTVLDLINGSIKESDLDRFHYVCFSDEDIECLSTVELSYLMSEFIEDDSTLLFEEVDD